jgi:putative tryptophan/tyrosine transport system substrate-binding protein
MVNRRRFLLTALATAAGVARVADALAPRRVAFLCPTSCSNLPATHFSGDLAFLRGLEQAGFPSGPALYFDMAGAGVGYKRLPEMAEQLVRRNADVIVAFGNAAARAARRATSTVPVVMVGVADPVETGLIASHGRPGGNLTGLAVPYEQLVAKHIELLKEINPTLAHVAIFWTPSSKCRRRDVSVSRRRFGR